ncbi:MAG: DUF523 domain-containing protein [Proteobacteria bacterium]|nr:DUF523 domain-containing protein [Pseudomonadota bacterium]
MRFYSDTVRIGISACLLGQRVRYDGSHKRHAWLIDQLGRYVTWVPVCPEVEFGLGVPRETISLVASRSGEIRLIATESRRDLTDDMNHHAAARVEQLIAEDLSGYVLKTRSPSCGLTQVAVLASPDDRTPLSRDGRGIFAAALRERFPGLPVVEEHQLDSCDGRNSFMVAVSRYHADRCSAPV